MIVRQREIHHGLYDHLTVHGDRTFLYRVHAEYAGLRRVEDRCREQGTKNTAIGDGKGAASHIFNGELLVSRLGSVDQF